jgi:hypothetical protein
VSLGFEGGQVLALRITEKTLEKLEKALPAGGWHDLDSDDGPVRVNLDKLVYLSAESGEPRVGFG